jgi:hypothetical protein
VKVWIEKLSEESIEELQKITATALDHAKALQSELLTCPIVVVP